MKRVRPFMNKTLGIYIALITVLFAVIVLVLQQGRELAPVGERPPIEAKARPVPSDADSLWTPLRENFHEPLSRLLLQVIVIVLATRLVGGVFSRWGQPAVVGEVLAGIM